MMVLFVTFAFAATALLLVLALSVTTGPSVSMAQPAGSTPAATATAAASATPSGPAGEPASTAFAVPATTGTVAGTPGAGGTPTPRPVPTGTPPADPLALLNIFNFFQPGDTLVKKDVLQLDGQGADEVLYTITGPDRGITSEYHSAISVLMYDPIYREWQPAWSSGGVQGKASPLPAASLVVGYNGGDLLRTGRPILALRTTTRDGRAHLRLWGWDGAARKAEPLKMQAPDGQGVKDAVFDADLDLTLVDLNDDGVYEVVADNVNSMQVWGWDRVGNRFVRVEGR